MSPIRAIVLIQACLRGWRARVWVREAVDLCKRSVFYAVCMRARPWLRAP